MNFTEIKQVIIDRAKNADACADQFRRAAKAETMPELLKVITNNFQWCCGNKIIDIELLSKIEVPILDEARLYFNRDVSDGYCLVVDATVRAWGNATVWALNNATVRASGNVTVLASGNATVEAFGNAFTLSYNSVEHKSEGNSIIRWIETNRVVFGGKILNP